jgi:hypothetical protein
MIGFFYFRRKSKIALIAMLFLAVGCTPNSKPSNTAVQKQATLSVRFDHLDILAKSTDSGHDLKLIVKNTGAHPVNILKVDGGCSCRRIEQTSLPFVLPVDSELSLPINMQNKRTSGTQSIAFKFESDHGTIHANCDILILQALITSPDSISMSIYENASKDDAGFAFVVRQVVRSGENQKPVHIDLGISGDIGIRQTSKTNSDLAGAATYKLEETTFEGTILNKQSGFHKTILRLTAGEQIVEMPVVFNIIPFISTVPDKLILTQSPSRVFMRCPDDSIEFGSIVSSPEGILAVIVSPRELRISIRPEYSKAINGVIMTKTLIGSHMMNIPVSYYPKLD